MSPKADRRDHAPVVRQCRCMDAGHHGHQGPTCVVCGEPLRTVYHRLTDSLYWRHIRRG